MSTLRVNPRTQFDGFKGPQDQRPQPPAPLAPKPLWTYGTHIMPGALCSKSNSRRIVRMGTRIAVIKSKEAIEYVERFKRLMPRLAKPFEGPVVFKCDVYYADRRRDLDVALIQDCLQVHGIIKNDRQVVEIHARRFLDKANPRTVFQLNQSERPMP